MGLEPTTAAWKATMLPITPMMHTISGEVGIGVPPATP